ncbi:MAG: hypothetical protein ACI9D5_002095 [Candidatus Endobugula sp.]|jgi:hypothetical protein
MITFFLGFILLALVITGMAVGVLMGRRPITGSCGGIGAALGVKNYNCDICGDDPNKCDEKKGVNIGDADGAKRNTLSYDAMDDSKNSS